MITNETVEEDKKQEESKDDEQKPSTENPSNDNTGNVASGNNGETSSAGSNTGSKPNSGSSTTKPSTGGNSNQGSQKPSTPSHTHNWVQQHTTVHHPEKGHNEQYVIKEEWTESIPIYETVVRSYCSACHQDITDIDIPAHAYQHAINGENGGHYEKASTIQTGTNTINHPAEYGTRYVIDEEAYDEEVLIGYTCSCGAKK